MEPAKIGEGTIMWMLYDSWTGDRRSESKGSHLN